MSENNNVTALTIARPDALSAYEPRDLREARELAKVYADSRLVPNAATEAKVMLIMATGADLRISPTAALRAIHIIGDKPSISAQLKLALCLREKSVCRYFKEVESTEEKATYETWRVGDDAPTPQTYTIEDAKRQLGADFVDKKDGAWFKVRRRMLRWRCIGELADRKYPELMLGLPTSEELADDIIDMKPVPAPMQLDGALLGAASTMSEVAAVEKEERKEERRAEANAIEPPEEAFKRWQETLNKAITTAQCDAVASEAQKRFEKGDPNRDRAREMVGAAKDRLRNAHKLPPSQRSYAPAPEAGQQSLPTNPIDKPRDRVPGEDDDQ